MVFLYKEDEQKNGKDIVLWKRKWYHETVTVIKQARKAWKPQK